MVSIGTSTSETMAQGDQEIAPYLSFPASQLLEEFGSGGHKPGSGAAAALMVMLSLKLSLTVARLTVEKGKSKDVVDACKKYIDRINSNNYGRLELLFKDDCEAFHLVISSRRARDEAKRKNDKKEARIQSKNALLHLQKATEIPLEIARLAMEAYSIAVDLFERGFQSARGDSGASASVALSAAKSSLFICYLNLKSFRDSPWAVGKRKELEILRAKIDESEARLFKLVDALSKEPPSPQLQLKV